MTPCYYCEDRQCDICIHGAVDADELRDCVKYAMHRHIAGSERLDTCRKCGHDLRHPIHIIGYK